MSWAWQITGRVKTQDGPAEKQEFVVVTHSTKPAEALEAALGSLTSAVYESGPVKIDLAEPKLIGQLRD